jgi:formylglycine-generating enzyme required for sulfatase activity
MADIFFSYKSDDRAAVEPLVRLLEAGGFTVWWDPSIVPGERYASVIHRALDEAACVVVAWSRRSVDSIWVQDEAGFARDRGVLVPVSLDGVDPPLGFRQLQTVSLADWQGRPDDPRVAHFLAGVRRLAGGSGKAEAAVVAPAPAPAATIPQAQPSKASSFEHGRIAVLVGGATAAVLLIAGMLFFLTQRDQTASSYSPARPRGPVPVERSFRDCGAGCPVMVIVPTGSFLMGSVDREPQRGSDEGPQHEVTISKVSAIGKFPVTVDDWDACVANRGCTDWPFVAKWGRGAQPVINVSWDDAKAYVAWLSRFTGKAYRLLSEAEREYIARAGTTTPFWWGATISTKRANYDGTQRYTDEPTGEFRQHAMPVDAFQPNPWGFYDVHGNAWEWVEDCYHDSYEGAPTDGSAWTTGDCNRRVLRGGSWASQPRNLRSAARFRLAPAIRGEWYGFRVARTCETSCTSNP